MESYREEFNDGYSITTTVNGNLSMITYHDLDGQLHRNDAPAKIQYIEPNTREEFWYNHGVVSHVIGYTGASIRVAFLDDTLNYHNENSPAVVTTSPDGIVREWFIHGEVPNGLFLELESDNMVYARKFYNRADGLVIERYDNNVILGQYYGRFIFDEEGIPVVQRRENGLQEVHYHDGVKSHEVYSDKICIYVNDKVIIRYTSESYCDVEVIHGTKHMFIWNKNNARVEGVYIATDSDFDPYVKTLFAIKQKLEEITAAIDKAKLENEALKFELEELNLRPGGKTYEEAKNRFENMLRL